jgi:hypothetical protein
MGGDGRILRDSPQRSGPSVCLTPQIVAVAWLCSFHTFKSSMRLCICKMVLERKEQTAWSFSQCCRFCTNIADVCVSPRRWNISTLEMYKHFAIFCPRRSIACCIVCRHPSDVENIPFKHVVVYDNIHFARRHMPEGRCRVPSVLLKSIKYLPKT